MDETSRALPTRAAELSIGDVAAATGVSVSTLRMWERRHGFPVPRRRASGHRRYDADDVLAVQRVRRRQDAGVRLDVAIADDRLSAAAGDGPAEDPFVSSVYAALRAGRGGLTPHRLTKRTLLALSWAIEDDVLAHADRPYLFGAFQHGSHIVASRRRWAELARTARATYALAVVGEALDEPAAAIVDDVVVVDISPDLPLAREWAVVCESERLPVALTAWEVPDQSRVAEADRLFEAVWTLDPVVVRRAARACAAVCVRYDAPGARDVLHRLETTEEPSAGDLTSATAMLSRALAYVDRAITPSSSR